MTKIEIAKPIEKKRAAENDIASEPIAKHQAVDDVAAPSNDAAAPSVDDDKCVVCISEVRKEI